MQQELKRKKSRKKTINLKLRQHNLKDTTASTTLQTSFIRQKYHNNNVNNSKNSISLSTLNMTPSHSDVSFLKSFRNSSAVFGNRSHVESNKRFTFTPRIDKRNEINRFKKITEKKNEHASGKTDLNVSRKISVDSDLRKSIRIKSFLKEKETGVPEDVYFERKASAYLPCKSTKSHNVGGKGQKGHANFFRKSYKSGASMSNLDNDVPLGSFLYQESSYMNQRIREKAETDYQLERPTKGERKTRRSKMAQSIIDKINSMEDQIEKSRRSLSFL